MKKAIFILVLFFLLFSPRVQFAQALEDIELVIAPSTPSEKKVDYLLPYPGLLPDNPLYFLKTFRDKFIGFFVSDPLKKAELNLLNADKRLNGAFYLFNNDRNKIKLVQSTISKAENYFEEAISKTIEAKKQGMNIEGLVSRLSLASAKHLEVVRSLKDNSLDYKQELTTLEKKILNLEKQTKELELSK